MLPNYDAPGINIDIAVGTNGWRATRVLSGEEKLTVLFSNSGKLPMLSRLDLRTEKFEDALPIDRLSNRLEVRSLVDRVLTAAGLKNAG